MCDKQPDDLTRGVAIMDAETNVPEAAAAPTARSLSSAFGSTLAVAYSTAFRLLHGSRAWVSAL